MLNNRAKFIIILILLFAGLLVLANLSQAALKFGDTQTGITTTAGAAGVAQVQWLVIATTFIKALLGLVGMIFLILIIYGGFLWMTAHGKEDQIKKAKNLIVNAVAGLAIITMAYALTYFVSQALEPTAPGATGTGGNQNIGIFPP